jgi:quercetin dioxygenase-like cupin family protein
MKGRAMPVFKFDDLPVARPAPETYRREVHSEHVMVTIVDFVHGPSEAAPPHQHPHEQVTYIAEGEVNFSIGEGATRTVDRVQAGDMVVVPPDAPHTVELISATARLIDCFYPIREDFL